uniref:Transposase n=1 Tax=Heterorhabditis bacteriophora TaxID=37862 RepID=A0A1I7WGD3_HETBA
MRERAGQLDGKETSPDDWYSSAISAHTTCDNVRVKLIVHDE